MDCRGRYAAVLVVAALMAVAGGCAADPLDPDAVRDGGSVDGGSVDGGSVDGGSVDGGSVDGGSVDGGSADDGSADGGSVDGGSVDGGSVDGGSVDGGSVDGGSADGGSADGGSVRGPTLYPPDRIHSPLTFDVGERLRLLTARGRGLAPDVFAQVGDSISAGDFYLSCFASPGRDLDSFAAALTPTLEHFLAGDAAGVSPFERESLAVLVSQPAFMVIDGDPSRLDQELDALSPAFVLIMIGANDVGWRTFDQYASDMDAMMQVAMDAGVVPLMSTLPPRATDPGQVLQNRQFNAAIRALAEARQVPLVDLHLALLPLPSSGLRSDGVHLTTDYAGGSDAACDLTPAGLQFATAMRNLIVLQQLDRTVRVVLDGLPALDAPVPPRPGSGTPSDPVIVTRLPFGEVRDLAGAASTAGLHPGCGPWHPSAGTGLVYRLDLASAQALSFGTSGLGPAEVELRVVNLDDPAAGCIS